MKKELLPEEVKKMYADIHNKIFPSKEDKGISAVDCSYRKFMELIKNSLMKSYELGEQEGYESCMAENGLDA